jgi:TP901 family phage tail tape measure protein
MEGKAKSVGSAIGSALTTGAVAAGAALVGVATVGAKTYMDIESAAADAASKMDLSAIAQASGKSMEEAFTGVKEHVMSLADELGQLNTNAFDPTQIAQACANLAAGRFDVASASAADLRDVLALATATNYDLSSSAGLAMSTMNQFGMGVDDLGRISDVYATAAGKSAAGMTDFDYAMQQAGPVAKGVGMSFEELTARVSKLADAGYGGEKSGTALRTAMMALTSITKPQGEALERLGITYDQINPKTHSFGETLDLLVAKGADIYDFGEIFGKEGAAIVYSSAQQSAAVKDLTAQLENSKGAASSMAKMMLDSLKGSLDAAMGAASSLAYAMGKDLEPSLRGALDWFSSTGAPAIREFYTAIKEGNWSKVGEMISSGIKAGWSKLKDLGGQLVGWLKGVNWGALGEYVTKGIYAAWGELKSLGGDLLDSLQAVDWGSIGTALLDSISSAIDSVIDYAEGIYDYFAEIDWGGVWDSLVSAWDSAIEGLSNVGSTILGYFDSIDWGTVGFKIGQAIRDAIVALADIGQKVWDYLTSADWSGAGSSISEKIKAGLAKLKEFWTEFKSGISSVDFATAGKEIGDKIKAGLGKVADYAKSIYEKIKTGWDSWIAEDGPKKLGESFAHSVVKGVVDLGKWIYDKIADYWKSNGSSIGSNFSALFHSAIDFGKTALKAAYDFVVGFANTVLTAGKGTIGAAILEIIGGAMNSAWEGAGDSIIAQATQWRKDAEGIWEASDFDTTIAVTKDWLDGDPLPKDGETRSLTYAVSTTGEDISAIVDAIPGTKGASGSGKASGYWAGGKYWLTSSSGGVQATDWARQMGQSGASYAGVQAKLREAQQSGATLTAADMEKIMSEFLKGQEEYDAAHQTAAEEAAEIEIAAAEEEAEIETEAAEEAAATTTEAAKVAASTEKSAAQELYRTLIGGSKEAANAIKIGSEIGAGSVKIGLTGAGKEIAIIGQVAQQRFTEAGGILYDRVQVAGSGFSGAVSAAISGLQSKIQYAGSAIQTSAGGAGAALAAKINSAASDFQLKGTYAGSAIQNGAGNAASKLSLGASDILTKSYNAGSAIRSGGSDAGSALSTGAGSLRSAASAVSSAASKLFTENPFGHLYASGTVTSGPELAVIGEDGPANPEFVIPTKTKRWDLLYAALRAYGVRGFAEGTATGGTAAAVDPDAMAAYFSITGLASMSKQVQRVINSLKDFFRISWGIIKSEGATYWKQINTVLTAEVTTFRDSAWQAIIDVRNTSITSFQEILAGVKSAFSEMWPSISGYVDEVKTGLTSAMTDAGTSTVDAINQMILNAEGALTAWATKWAETWDQMLADLSEAQTQIQEACTEIATELAKINVSVNINASINSGYGGGGGGGGYMDWNFGGDDDWLAPTGDWSTNGYRQTTTGPCPLGGGCPDYNRAVRDSIMPLDDRYIGGGGGGGGYQLPWIFAARGALIDDGPQKVIAGEAGPELILPAKLTRMFLSLADAGLGSAGSRPIVIEDHTEHRWYLDGKEVTNALMDRVVKQLKLNGAVPVR